MALAVEGSSAKGEGGSVAIRGLSDLITTPEPPPVGNPAIARFGLALTLQQLRETGWDVLVIEGVPEIGFQVPRTLFNAQHLSVRIPPSPDTVAFEARNHRVKTIIGERTGIYGARRFVSVLLDKGFLRWDM